MAQTGDIDLICRDCCSFVLIAQGRKMLRGSSGAQEMDPAVGYSYEIYLDHWRFDCMLFIVGTTHQEKRMVEITVNIPEYVLFPKQTF